MFNHNDTQHNYSAVSYQKKQYKKAQSCQVKGHDSTTSISQLPQIHVDQPVAFMAGYGDNPSSPPSPHPKKGSHLRQIELSLMIMQISRKKLF